MRVVGCVDMDCFYAQVVMRRRPELLTKPVGIKQKYLIVTSNYVARSRGVGKMDMVEDALKVCPDMVVVDGSDLTPFRLASEEIAQVLGSFGAPVERVGMDESFIDLSELVRLRKEQFDRSERSLVFKGHVTGAVDTLSIEERRSLAIGSQLISEMRATLYEKLGFKCCGGVSISKLGAKLAAELHKPDQQTVILPDQLPCLVKTKPLACIQGIGRTTAKVLHKLFLEHYPAVRGLETSREMLCSHVLRLPPDAIRRALPVRVAKVVEDLVRGVDTAPVVHSGSPKTVSVEETSLPHPETYSQARQRVFDLCGRLLEFVNKRRSQKNEVPAQVRISISDKGRQLKVSRRDRNHCSRQFRLLGSEPLASQDAFMRVVEPNLRKVLPTTPFRLCRVNLAVSDFRSAGSTSGLLTSFVQGPGGPALKKRALACPKGVTETAKVSADQPQLQELGPSVRFEKVRPHDIPMSRDPQENPGMTEQSTRRTPSENTFSSTHLVTTIDPAFLAELPADLAEEIIANPDRYTAATSSSTFATAAGASSLAIPEGSGLDPAALQALPSDLRREVLAQAQSQRRAERKRRGTLHSFFSTPPS